MVTKLWSYLNFGYQVFVAGDRMGCRSALCERVSRLLQGMHTAPEKKRMLGREFVGKRSSLEGRSSNQTVANYWRKLLGNRGKRIQNTNTVHQADMRKYRIPTKT